MTAPLALPAPSPEREMEHAQREMHRMFDLWNATACGSCESWRSYEAYRDAVERYANVFETEERR